MALLSFTTRPGAGWTRARLRAASVLLGSGLLLAGCSIFGGLGSKSHGLSFSHELHVVQEELECVICHGEALTDDRPGMPAPDTCLLCHDVLDEEKPPEQQVASLFEGEEFLGLRYSALPDEVIFSHVAHTGYQDCGDCHVGIETDEQLGEHIAVDMAACVECHESNAAPGECNACHVEVDQQWTPENHSRQWELAHGRASRAHLGGPATDCSMCHRESQCVGCHLEEPPRDHNNNFRLRTHGFLASMDRSACATCHRSDSCDRCHRETRPRSHRGRWGSVKNRHCLGCHFPERANNCSVCHQGTPSHLLAAPKPSWHTPAMNCRQCHGISADLPHVDKGDDCNACHL